MRKDNIRERAILEFYIMDMYGQNGGEILTVMQVFLGLVISILFVDTRQAKLDADARVADDDLEPDGGALVSLVWAFA